MVLSQPQRFPRKNRFWLTQKVCVGFIGLSIFLLNSAEIRSKQKSRHEPKTQVFSQHIFFCLFKLKTNSVKNQLGSVQLSLALKKTWLMLNVDNQTCYSVPFTQKLMSNPHLFFPVFLHSACVLVVGFEMKNEFTNLGGRPKEEENVKLILKNKSQEVLVPNGWKGKIEKSKRWNGNASICQMTYVNIWIIKRK